MEYDEGDRTPRLYNQRGERLRVPGAADRRLIAPPDSSSSGVNWTGALRGIAPGTPLSDGDWIDHLVASPDRRSDRRRGLERRFGPPRGRVGGLDRYVKASGDGTDEVLVNPEAVVAVEANVARGGALVAHTIYGHESRDGGTLIRRLTRAEHALSDGSGGRAVPEVEVTNVRLGTGGRR
jgi:hypothetical protein